MVQAVFVGRFKATSQSVRDSIARYGKSDLAERTGVFKANLDNINKTGPTSANTNRLSHFTFVIASNGFRPFAPFLRLARLRCHSQCHSTSSMPARVRQECPQGKSSFRHIDRTKMSF